MSSSFLRRGALRLLGLALPFAATAVAAAQTSGPRNPKLDTAPSPVIGYAIIVVMGLAILAISLYPSKRSHTDL
jgi:hypothetical protein